MTGSGGTGKTRLSLKVAEALLESFPAGVWLVELAPLSDPELVIPTVAEVLEVQKVPGTPLIDTLCSYLKNKRALLILDNCEHVLSVCAELAEKLLQKSPELYLLASSWEILIYPVKRLSAYHHCPYREGNHCLHWMNYPGLKR